MSGGRGSSGAMAAIPGNARKVVQNLKEVVGGGHGEEEIFAMLKECNMDPNETAQRLMNQDTFHEVKRKKDKKKETTAGGKDSSDGRSRGSSSAYRGGRGGGRGGGSAPRHHAQSESNGRAGKAPLPKENGNHAPPPSSGSTVAPATPVLPNGTVQYTSSTGLVTHGSWSKLSGHATMAEMLKASTASSNGPPPSLSVLTAAPSSAGQQQFPMYSSSDPVHHPFADQRSVNREKASLGNQQRPIGERLPGVSSPTDLQDDRQASPPRQQETAKVLDSGAYRSVALGNGRPAYQPQQSVAKLSGANMEWKPKIGTRDEVVMSGLNALEETVPETVQASDLTESEVLSVSTKFQNLSARDEQQVIMPNNFQAQGDLGLSFGSFGEPFGSSLPSGFGSEDGLDMSGSSDASAAAKDSLHEQSPSGAEAVASDEAVLHQDSDIPVQRETLVSNTQTGIPIPSAYTTQADMTKFQLRSAQPQYSYLPAGQSYSPNIGMASHIPSLDAQEPQLMSTSLKQQYADSTASYYSPSFRPGSDGDARYGQYSSAKYSNSGSVAASGQHLASHEASNPTSLSSSSSVSQSPQQNTQIPSAPQQPLQVHAYPAQPTGMPVGHFSGNVFGYQYPGYTFVPSPYQHSYAANYPQQQVSSYSPSANYAPTVKYTLPQYKPGSTANAPMSAASGGGYFGTASSMYAANPSATASNTPGYEDATAAQYKDSNLYVHHGPQQGDGTRLWQLTNDIAAAQQTSSFYALSGQNQHTSYAQQSSHAHPMAGYTSLYHHPSQQGSAAHQMIQQQPQTLSGATAAGSSQVGASSYHQQLQRMQQQQQLQQQHQQQQQQQQQHQHQQQQHPQQQQQQPSWNY